MTRQFHLSPTSQNAVHHAPALGRRHDDANHLFGHAHIDGHGLWRNGPVAIGGSGAPCAAAVARRRPRRALPLLAACPCANNNNNNNIIINNSNNSICCCPAAPCGAQEAAVGERDKGETRPRIAPRHDRTRRGRQGKVRLPFSAQNGHSFQIPCPLTRSLVSRSSFTPSPSLPLQEARCAVWRGGRGADRPSQGDGQGGRRRGAFARHRRAAIRGQGGRPRNCAS